jgi:virginiamycin B lyase
MRAIPWLLLAAAFIAAESPSSAPQAQRGERRFTLDVAFDEWTTPSKPPFAHDVARAPDGSVWYTAQRANALGRLDPSRGTGEFKQYPLPTPASGPHGLVSGPDGNIWYSGNSAGLIGRLNPKTGKVTEYRMPDAAAKDPHTLAFDSRAILWFTVQEGNFVGRLDPKTGRIDLVPLPTPNARPYDIKINSKDVPFFVEFGSNAIGSVDPATMKITEYRLPGAAVRPRRMAIAPDDGVYYTDYATGFLGYIDPLRKVYREQISPGGPTSRPYGIAMTPDGAVWYCETGEPSKNMLVRYDPKTKEMRSWPIPGGGQTVRYMVADPLGNLWLAESGAGIIAHVRVKWTPRDKPDAR